ncbi:MAG TPA: hypothetical protein VF247_04590 [Candidatus Krumholzibacteria bacterium]
MMQRIIRICLFGVTAASLLAGCESRESATPTPTGPLLTKVTAPEFPGADHFVSGITNPYLAYEPGKVFHYCGETSEGSEEIVVTVTDQTREIMGVTTTVIHDQAYVDGALVEDTFDWVAQDEDGNVWYFGEHSETIENGQVVSTEGSWEAGVDGALPGVLMLADPEKGMSYAQEYAPDIAEDQARVKSTDASVSIDLGDFVGVLQTLEWTPLEPGQREYKFYAPGTGQILEESTGGRDAVALCSVE